MAFNNSPGRAEYTATAGQTVFTFVFKAYNAADLKVYLTPAGAIADDTTDLLTLTTDYTVAISGDVGGTVTLVTPATNGDALTLVRTLDIDRIIEYQTNGDLLADTLNQDQNYQTYLIADKESDNTRFLSLPESAQGITTQIPPPTPLNFFQWNATGTAIINVSSLSAGGFIWTAADVYNKTETNALLALKVDQTDFDDKSKLWDSQTTTHDFTTDADYTLTATQNLYGRIILTDTGVVLTTARNVITDNIEKSFIVQNDTAQSITVKTSAGTGILITAGSYANLFNDGTNIITVDTVYNPNLLAEFEVTGAAVTSVDFSGLDINTHKSYKVEFDLNNATASGSIIYAYVNNDSTLTNYETQNLSASNTSVSAGRTSDPRISFIGASGYTNTVAIVQLVSGYSLWTTRQNFASPSSNISFYGGRKTATVTNITQLTFTASVASSIGVGSKIRIYRGDV